MMYQKKSDGKLLWQACARRLRVEARNVLEPVIDEALDRMANRFEEEMMLGGLRELEFTTDELKALLRVAADKVLGPGGKRALHA